MLILASESPRRRELLKRLLPVFSVEKAQIEELKEGPELRELPRLNALLKAEAVAQKHPADFTLGSDTGVFSADRMLGKPRDLADARTMLRELSGKTHEVITGVALICPERAFRRSWNCSTRVTFAPLDERAITRYLEAVSVLDKAGAYGIQEHPELLGASWEGELENVIGLPLLRLKQELADAGLTALENMKYEI